VPLFDRVLIQRVTPSSKTVGGIVLPEAVKRKTNEAKVIAVGKGVRNSEGKFTPLSVEVGDLVIVPDFRGDDIKLNGDDYVLIREEDLLAKVEHTDQRPPSSKKQTDIPDMRDLPKS